MDKIIECVPNFSEGRRPEIVNRIADVIKTVSDTKLLDVQTDKDHNRSVISFVGTPASVKTASFEAAKMAVALIDLNHHTGEHPRMGAVDVIPFIPVRNVTTEECITISKGVGLRIGQELQIPVYLYEDSATKPEWRNLANVRKGEFEGLRDEIGTNPARIPDFGPNKIHPTAGATAIGARMPLIAYNVDLETDDIKIAKKIAKKIRESSGGLPTVKALGMMVAERGIAQVSMNLCNYTVTSIHTAYKTIEKEASSDGITIRSSEVVGLLPRNALKDEWIRELKLTTFKPEQIIENRI